MKHSVNMGNECASCLRADRCAFSGVSGIIGLEGISVISGGSDGGSGWGVALYAWHFLVCP